jgi:hypothetical protein
MGAMESREILESQVAATLGLVELRPGRHTLSGEKASGLSVVGLWVAHILPSFHPPATVAVVVEEQHTFGAFATIMPVSRTWDAVEVVDAQFADDWLDPVVDAVREVDLFDLGGCLSLDGISYELNMHTLASQSQVCFSNPVSRALIRLEQAIFQVASDVIDLGGGPPERQYLETWREYLARG